MGEWERNSFHQLAFTNIQLSYLCNLFQTAEIQTPKSISYLKSNEKNESFQAEQEFFFGLKKKYKNTEQVAYYRHKKSIQISSQQKLDGYLG